MPRCLQPQGLERGGGVDEAPDARVGGNLLIQGVRIVGGELAGRPVDRGSDQLRAHVFDALTQVGEADDVPVLLEIEARVRHPDLHPGDLHLAVHGGQRAQGILVLVPEEVAQEVVLVRLVVVRLDVEGVGLRASAHLHVAPLALLLAEDRRGGEPAEAQFGLEAEEALAALDQCTVQGQAHVAGLDLLDDLVLVPGVVQLHLVLEVEGGLGVVVGVDLELLPDVAHQVQLDPLVEVEGGDPPLVHRDPRVVGARGVDPEDDLGRPLWTDVDRVPAEDPVEGLAPHLDLGDQPLHAGLGILLHTLQPVGLHGPFQIVLEVLVQGHGHRRAVIEAAAHAAVQDVLARVGVVDPLVRDVVRVLEVDTPGGLTGGGRVLDRPDQIDFGAVHLQHEVPEQVGVGLRYTQEQERKEGRPPHEQEHRKLGGTLRHGTHAMSRSQVLQGQPDQFFQSRRFRLPFVEDRLQGPLGLDTVKTQRDQCG